MTTGAVLCGGQGKRMGRTKHDLLLPSGATLLEHVAGVLKSLCRDVVVVGPELHGWTCIADERDGQGPLGGIEALLGSGLDERYLVCPCDMPRVTEAPLRALIDVASSSAVLHLAGEQQPRPLPMLVSADALPAVRELLDGGRRAVYRLVEAIRAELVAGPGSWAELLADVDTPGEWAEHGDG